MRFVNDGFGIWHGENSAHSSMDGCPQSRFSGFLLGLSRHTKMDLRINACGQQDEICSVENGVPESTSSSSRADLSNDAVLYVYCAWT
jgi:hypothetical protein